MEQDGRIAEVNQMGLKSNRFNSGSLMAQEYGVYYFNKWVLEQLGEA